MDRKTLFLWVVVSTFIAVMLVALGVLIGRLWSGPQVFVLDQVSESANLAGEVRSGQVIAVVGESAVEMEPEIALLFFQVESCDADAGRANEEVNRILAAVTERLQEIGVPESDIVPTEFSLYPRYENYTVGRIVGFCAANDLVVKTDDLEGVGGLLDEAIAAGVNQVYRVVFTVEDRGTAREDAIRLAYDDAETQAEQLAQLLGQPLGPALNAEVEVTDNLSNFVTGYFGGGGSVAPQEGTLRAKVTLTYVVGE